MRDFRKIKAWQLADNLAVAVYEVSKSFPREEIHGLTSQGKRAASPVPANIVEGAKDYARFLAIARQSLAGTRYFPHLAKRLGYINDERAERVLRRYSLVCAL